MYEVMKEEKIDVGDKLIDEVQYSNIKKAREGTVCMMYNLGQK